MTTPTTFFDLVRSGAASVDDVDAYVERWRAEAGQMPVQDYLGFSSHADYVRWLLNPSELQAIIEGK